MNITQQLLDSNKNFLIEGPGGTGKSTILRELVSKKKNCQVVAQTGIAALNVDGLTIHTFFEFKSKDTILTLRQKKLKSLINLECLIIDEISMVRADLLDMVDIRLRAAKENDLPFGGVQLIMFGDLYQLPPIVMKTDPFKKLKYDTKFFFSAKAMKNTEYEIISLDKIHRQTDMQFINILNAIRTNIVTQEELDVINDKCVRKYDGESVYLATTNGIADEINKSAMLKIDSKAKKYFAVNEGFRKYEYPAEYELTLKKGCRVMFIRNDTKHNKFVNGDVGTIVFMEKDRIGIKKHGGGLIKLEPYTWVKELDVDGEMEKQKFTQFPLKLAYAITIHKSQGKTFESMHLDLGGYVFSAGQTYVALSRARNMENLSLERPIKLEDVFIDKDIKKLLG